MIEKTMSPPTQITKHIRSMRFSAIAPNSSPSTVTDNCDSEEFPGRAEFPTDHRPPLRVMRATLKVRQKQRVGTKRRLRLQGILLPRGAHSQGLSLGREGPAIP